MPYIKCANKKCDNHAQHKGLCTPCFRESQNINIPVSKHEQTRRENARLMKFWDANKKAPQFEQISKRASKKGISGFHKGLYMSQRGISKFGDLQQDVPFPE